MSFSSHSSISSYNQRFESFQEKLKEQSHNISVQKDALNFSFSTAMKKLQAPKSEKKKKLPLIYVSKYVLPSTPSSPFIPFDKTLSPAQRFEKRWQYRIGKLSADYIPPFKYEKIDFTSDLNLSDSDGKESSNDDKDEAYKKNEDGKQENEISNANNNKDTNITSNHENINQKDNNQDSKSEGNLLKDPSNSENSEDLKIEDLDGSNNDLSIEEEEEENENESEKLSSNKPNELTEVQKVVNDENNNLSIEEEEENEKISSNKMNDLADIQKDVNDQHQILALIEEEEEENNQIMTATQLIDAIDLLDNQKGEYEEEEEEAIEKVVINKKNGIKMSDDANEIFNFSSDYSQGADE